jgi:hypothetical protein
MLTGLSPSVLIGRSRACPAIVDPGSLWVQVAALLPLVRSTTRSAATAPGIPDLELEQLAVDTCTTKAPCGGQTAGPSPIDRRKQGLQRSITTEAGGIPLAMATAPLLSM